MAEEKGRQFDPALIDLLLDHLDAFLTIREQFTDSSDELQELMTLIER